MSQFHEAPKCETCGEEMVYFCALCLEKENESLRRYAPPQPEWRERPMCAGWWASFPQNLPDSMLENVTELYVEFRKDYPNPDIRWFGPIPSPPAQETK